MRPGKTACVLLYMLFQGISQAKQVHYNIGTRSNRGLSIGNRFEHNQNYLTLLACTNQLQVLYCIIAMLRRYKALDTQDQYQVQIMQVLSTDSLRLHRFLRTSLRFQPAAKYYQLISSQRGTYSTLTQAVQKQPATPTLALGTNCLPTSHKLFQQHCSFTLQQPSGWPSSYQYQEEGSWYQQA